MRYSKAHSAQTRRSVLDAAAVKFREDGYAAVGVNAIAAAAKVTSGAIYSQFESKDALFGDVVEEGMQRLIAGLETFKAQGDDGWLQQFVDFYLGADHVRNAGTGCGLPALSVDVSRSDDEARAVYTEHLLKAARVVSADDRHRPQALLLLSALLGAVVVSRATGDDGLRRELLGAVADLAKAER